MNPPRLPFLLCYSSSIICKPIICSLTCLQYRGLMYVHTLCSSVSQSQRPSVASQRGRGLFSGACSSCPAETHSGTGLTAGTHTHTDRHTHTHKAVDMVPVVFFIFIFLTGKILCYMMFVCFNLGKTFIINIKSTK